ncbi:MAG: hypothetical protein ABIY50_12395, partial [Ignavibacteria bacterium]
MHPIVNVTGEERSNKVSDNSTYPSTQLDRYEPFHSTSLTYIYTNTEVFSKYDLQSNGVTQEIWQDPLTPGNVHGCFMKSDQDAGWTDRTVVYIFSTDFGATWNNLGNVPTSGIRSGFGAITGLSNGAALIACHTADGGGTVRTQAYADLGAGFGAFVRLDPGASPGGDAIWPRIIATSSITNPVKFVVTASINSTSEDLTYTNTGTSLTTPGTFNGWVQYQSANAETYSFARGDDGRIGNAYLGGGADLEGDVLYRFSTDNGLTWSSPTTAWNSNFTTDSLGAVRGVTMSYLGNVPYVAFETGHIAAGSYVPGLPSQIRIWSPSINGGTPKIIADSSTVPFYPNITLPDVLFPIARPSIGKSSSGNALVVSFVSTTANYNADTVNFFGGWLTYSTNAGNIWSTPERSTPTVPIRDWRYLCVSPTNNVLGSIMKVQMLGQSDSIPGSLPNGALPGKAQCFGITTDIVVTTGINTISTIVPGQFSLAQNFPNPFNPSTSIRFDIRNSDRVTLKVYNTTGQEVASLINNEIVSAGTKE